MTGRLQMTGRQVERGDAAVMKSYVPGHGYRKAIETPKSLLRAATGQGLGSRASHFRGVRAAEQSRNTRMKEGLAEGRDYVAQHGTFHSTKGGVRPTTLPHAQMRADFGNIHAIALKTGGRRGKGAVFVKPEAEPSVMRHEAAHLTPKRSSYRFAQIQMDPVKRAKEEARADFVAGNVHGRSPGSSGYARAAGDEFSRSRQHASQGGREDSIFSRRNMAHYRRVQQQMGWAAEDRRVKKVDTTMSDTEAARLAGHYDTRGPLPKGLTREKKMAAYEARYIHSGGRKAEKWHRRAQAAEVGRNAGLVGATVSAAGLLASRGHRTGPAMASRRVLRHITPRRTETAALTSALGGGWSELYGEHARSKRASYQNSPAGVAGSALTRMRAYTPEKKP